MVPARVSQIRHFDKKIGSLADQPPHVDVSVHLGELGESVVNNVLALELSAVLIESIRNKDRDIVHPRVARSAT